MMRTTVDIDARLLAEAEKITAESSPSKVVNTALRELMRRRKLQCLRRLIKETTLEDTWQEDEEAELEEMKKQRL